MLWPIARQQLGCDGHHAALTKQASDKPQCHDPDGASARRAHPGSLKGCCQLPVARHLPSPGQAAQTLRERFGPSQDPRTGTCLVLAMASDELQDTAESWQMAQPQLSQLLRLSRPARPDGQGAIDRRSCTASAFDFTSASSSTSNSASQPGTGDT